MQWKLRSHYTAMLERINICLGPHCKMWCRQRSSSSTWTGKCVKGPPTYSPGLLICAMLSTCFSILASLGGVDISGLFNRTCTSVDTGLICKAVHITLLLIADHNLGFPSSFHLMASKKYQIIKIQKNNFRDISCSNQFPSSPDLIILQKIF